MDALVKSYTFAEKKISEQGGQISETAQLRQMIEQLQAQIAGPQATGQVQDTAPATDEPPTLDAEQLEEIKQGFFDKFYEDPQGALSKFDKQRDRTESFPSTEPHSGQTTV